jgi:hypothetical protein
MLGKDLMRRKRAAEEDYIPSLHPTGLPNRNERSPSVTYAFVRIPDASVTSPAIRPCYAFARDMEARV